MLSTLPSYYLIFLSVFVFSQEYFQKRPPDHAVLFRMLPRLMAANKTRSFMRCSQHFFYISSGHNFPNQTYTRCIVGVRKFRNNFSIDFIATTLIFKGFERFTPVRKDRLWWHQMIVGFSVKTIILVGSLRHVFFCIK